MGLSRPIADRTEHDVCTGYSMNKQSHEPMSDRTEHDVCTGYSV